MRITILFVTFCLMFYSCKKNEKLSSDSQTDLNTQLQGRWYLISETHSGIFSMFDYKALATDYIEYKANGKAYSNLQGQYDLVYDYQLNSGNNTMLFNYLQTQISFMPSIACTSPGCLRPAEIKFISDKLLVIGNTFYDPNNIVVEPLTVIDSLSR